MKPDKNTYLDLTAPAVVVALISGFFLGLLIGMTRL